MKLFYKASLVFLLLLLIASPISAKSVNLNYLGNTNSNDIEQNKIIQDNFQSEMPQKIETIPEIVEVTTEVVVEIIKEITKIPREFVNVEEAQTWLDENQLPIVLIANRDGVIKLNSIQQDNRYNCNDYAQTLQQKALEAGYLITYCPVLNGYVWGVQVTNISGSHVGLLTRIKDSYYYVEPMPSFANSFKLVHIINADRN